MRSFLKYFLKTVVVSGLGALASILWFFMVLEDNGLFSGGPDKIPGFIEVILLFSILPLMFLPGFFIFFRKSESLKKRWINSIVLVLAGCVLAFVIIWLLIVDPLNFF